MVLRMSRKTNTALIALLRYNPNGTCYVDIGHTYRTSINSNDDSN